MSNACDCSGGLVVSMYKNRNRTIRATITGPGDLTDAKIWFCVKASRTDADVDALITKKSANNGGSDSEAIVVDGPNGIIDIFIIPSDTTTMSAPVDYWFDIVIETAAGQRLEAVSPSTFRLLQPVTLT